MAVLPLPQSDEARPSSAGAVIERLVFLLFMGTFVGAVAMMAFGLMTGEVRLLLMGSLLGVIAWFAREWLDRRGRFKALVESFEVSTNAAEVPSGDTPLAVLSGLLQELDRLERRRGSPAFEPWAVQTVRNEIRTTIERDPALSRLLEWNRRAA